MLPADSTGQFRLQFSLRDEFAPDATTSYILRKHGDYVIWGEGKYHRAFGEEDSTILSSRWLPE